MDTRDDGGPAFPFVDPTGGHPQTRFHDGMLLRDWFAGQALAGMCANTDFTAEGWPKLANRSYEAADAMIKARGQK